MTFRDTLLNGHDGAFDHKTMTPMQKLTVRFVLVGMVYYAFAAIEGMLMRIFQVDPNLFIGEGSLGLTDINQYFGILTAHPLVGIFGSTYLLVFGAFLFLVPYLMKKLD